jgi:cytosine/adenosine deaminase-related metal-dependent hydrolase
MTRKLIRHATVIGYDSHDQVVILEDHDIQLDGAWIESVHPSHARPADLPPAEEEFDATGMAALPGLVNTHQHLFQSVTRCHRPIQNAKLFDWLTTQYPIWAKFTYHDLYIASLISLGEMLLSGCTIAMDMHYLFPRGSDLQLEAILDAAEALGIRIVAGRGAMTLGHSQGGLPPDEVCQNDDDALRDMERVLERYHDSSRGAMRQISLQPCAPFNVTENVMRESLKLARDKGAIVQTHLAETHDETDYCIERYGCRPLELMEKWDWLGPDVSFAHCVTLNNDEVDLMAATGTGVAHCPAANMRLGSGVAPIRRMIDRGVTVGIGVDGSSSNDGMHVMGEVRLALYAQRGIHGPAGITVEEAFRLATQGGAKLLKRPELGNIAPGCAADIALYKIDTVERAGAIAQDPLGALVLTRPDRASFVFVQGQLVVRERQVTSLDMVEVVREANALVRRKFLHPLPELADYLSRPREA